VRAARASVPHEEYLAIELEGQRVRECDALRGAPIRVAVDGEVDHVGASETRRFRLK
jgi:hypothetical protein